MSKPLADDETLIVCSVLPDGRARFSKMRDPEDTFRKWRNSRDEQFLPVAALRTTVGLFEAATSFDLPWEGKLSMAAWLFWRVGLDPLALAPALIHLDEWCPLGTELLQDWGRAIAEAWEAA